MKHNNKKIFYDEVSRKSFTKVFWIFHISWWSFIIIIDLLRHIESIFTRTSVEIFLVYIYGSLAGIVLHILFMRIKHRSFSMFGLFGIIIFSSMIASYLWSGIEKTVGTYIQSLLFDKVFPTSSGYWGFPFFYAVLLITYSGLYFTIKIWLEWANQKNQTEKAINIAQTAQLQMLRYQLNPHFIFNSLSSLRALVENEKAETMITKLSEFLRYTLDEENKEEVPLIDEIQVTKNYLDIEKVRFGDQLIVNYNIDDLSEDYPVPSFILNPIIENAIKHGMNSSKLPLVIDITAFITDENALEIEVTNTGSLQNQYYDKDKNFAQTGLNNVEKRLAFLYPNSYSFKLYEAEGKVHAKIVLLKKFGNDNAR